jgi:hypothetical protein
MAVLIKLMPLILAGIGILTLLSKMIFTAVKGAERRNENNNAPILTVDAEIVAKRVHTDNRVNNLPSNLPASTTYFLTFEVESGSRIELQVPGEEYGLLVEGDTGRLIFQGTRYHKFERTNYRFIGE